MRATARLRELLAGEGMLLAPFVYDGFTARIAEEAGFDAAYMSGFATSMSRGLPDVGLLTQTEMTQNAAVVASAVGIPGHRGRGHGIRERDQRSADGPRVRAGGGGGRPRRGSGRAQEVRLLRRQAGHRARGGGAEDSGRRGRADGPGLRRHRADGRAGGERVG